MAIGQDRPGRARRFVRNRDGGDVGRPSHQKSGQPPPALPPPSSERSRAMDQQGADIAVPALANSSENLALAARTLSWHEAEPSREVTPGSEALRVIHREDDRGCGHHTHTGDRHQSPAGIRLLCPGFKSMFGLLEPAAGPRVSVPEAGPASRERRRAACPIRYRGPVRPVPGCCGHPAGQQGRTRRDGRIQASGKGLSSYAAPLPTPTGRSVQQCPSTRQVVLGPALQLLCNRIQDHRAPPNRRRQS